jgi:hypothetical protein
MNREDNCILIGKTWRDEAEGFQEHVTKGKVKINLN